MSKNLVSKRGRMNVLHAATLMLTVTAAAFATPFYSVTPITGGPPGATSFVPGSINDLGQTAGGNAGAPGIWSNGIVTTFRVPGNNAAFAAINDVGQIAGTKIIPPGGTEAFLYSNGTFTNLGNLGFNTASTDLNNSGQVVGYALIDSGPGHYDTHAFLYTGGNMIDLGTLGGSSSSASAINSSGQVVGSAALAPSASAPSGVGHAFLYSNGAMIDLGTLSGPGGLSSAAAINDFGQIVGSSGTDPFLYSDGTMIDLGVRGNASDINNAGQIVGSFYTSNTGGGNPHAFLYSNGAVIDLNSLIDPSLGITLARAFGINNGGQIIAQGSQSNYYLLSETGAAVPEPSTWLLFLSGSIVIALRRRRL